MFTVALTGGIGSGKSTVAEQLGALGAGVIDTDLLSRELTAAGHPVLERIAAVFGGSILQSDGSLDRAALRERIFRSPAERAQLESILHPAIKNLMLERLATLDAPYAVLVIPLLFETGQQTLVDRILVVDVPEHVQIERVKRRSGLPEDEILRIVASQSPRQERNARADDILDNSGDTAALSSQVRHLHRRYFQFAKSK
ncbi:dephospho-CoA kinase [uncultured Thiocystis sp.]|jgi:dephospho-CoA kinase|uniref:dephospho-CoA kinase n=1 Tax=uncultured Thiocystis sp. TaxID=1202134 RepID=UPI0025E8D218|nr:dephospho-CoA kinase [uncultured Thiocystis sp.]